MGTGSGRIPNEIYTESGRIGHELTQIQLKIEEMKKLNKKKGIFVDTTEQFGTLSAQITEGMNRVKNMMEQLDLRAQNLSSAGNASEAARNAVQALKLRHTQNMSDFLAVCQERNSRAQKDQARKQVYLPKYPPNQAMTGMGLEMSSEPGEGDNRALMTGQVVQDPLQFGNERAAAMKTVQKSINEIATMFKQMSEMISLQDTQISRIDANVDGIADSLDAGTQDLTKFLTNISSNRSLLIKIFGIVLVFIVIFIVFLS